MLRGKGTLFAAALVGGLAASSGASAGPVFTVDGIGFGSNANQISTTIWEHTVVNAGETLTGIGRVNTIDSVSCGGLCWTAGQNGRELTFTFSYTVEKIGFVGNPALGVAQALFSGGDIHFYSDSAQNLVNTPAGLTVAHASDGNLWIQLAGAATGDACDASCFNGAGAVVTLKSNFFTTGGLGGVDSGTGHGFLDSIGGPVSGAFDTNTFFGGSDIDLSSSFNHNVQGTAANFPLTGTAGLQAFVVPEPGSLLLLGTGLLSLAGAGFSRRRRSRA
jgi:hypothetical protein